VARKLSSLGCREVPRSGDGSHRKWLNPACRGKSSAERESALTIHLDGRLTAETPTARPVNAHEPRVFGQ